MEDEWKNVIPLLAQIHVDTLSPSGSASTSGANSLLQENYIGSDGGLAAVADLLSLSDDDAGFQSSSHQRPPRHFSVPAENPDVII